MLIKDLYDNEYEFDQFSKIRITARAILLNEHNEIGYIKIKGEDDFGVRNHYESPGGQVELDETFKEAVKREVLEETGFVCTVHDEVGVIINRYNLINTITVSRYFVCKLMEKKTPHRTDSEMLLMQELEFKPLTAWLEHLSKGESKVDRLVHKREYEVLKAYQSLIQ